MPRHVLIVGGTGMLAGLAEALARDGGRLSHLSRQASTVWGQDGYDCDYHDEAQFNAALEAATSRAGRPDLAIAWPIEAAPLLSPKDAEAPRFKDAEVYT